MEALAHQIKCNYVQRKDSDVRAERYYREREVFIPIIKSFQVNTPKQEYY